MRNINNEMIINFDELTQFEKNMLLKDNINIKKVKINCVEDAIFVSQLLSRYHIYVILDLIARIQFILYKNHLNNVCSKEVSDEDVYGLASPAISKKLDYKTNNLMNEHFDVNTLKQIITYTNIIDCLTENGIKADYQELKSIVPSLKLIQNWSSERACIEGINLREQLNGIGLEEYTDMIITSVIGKEAYTFDNSETNLENIKINFKISKQKTPVKKLIKDYQKRSTK